MVLTVGKYDVHSQPIGVIAAGMRKGRFTAQWSIYLRPVNDDRDEPVDQGETSEFDNAALAEQEGLRIGEERARALDSGTTTGEPYRDYD